MEKERLLVRDLRKFIDEDKNYSIALVAGIRRTGKTTMMHQLEEQYKNTVYIDFSKDPTGDEKLEAFLKNPSGLLLLDEITYLENYDVECEDIYNIAAAGNNFKTVITGSSPAHISKLGNMRLGGGRARVFYLPLITFTEYLYFTDRIESYSSYENACASDFKDYLQLKGLNQGLSVVFDMQYLNSAYDVNGTSNNSRKLGLLECGA